MAANRRRHPRRTTAIAAPALLAALALTGCGAVDTALDCARTADSIADSVTDLQQAVRNAANDPTRADEALNSIEKNLRGIGDRTDNADIDRAVDDLGTAVADVRTALKNGDHTPDLTPVTDAAGELTKVCTP
ncbi:hypothetical protein [Streptomyces mexicanus]|jgi:hypothetical protein|uniref:hypothetical protein n=1 Tax=Streptomyces mexicanus TaxID=178566 RepID=UPI0031EA138E